MTFHDLDMYHLQVLGTEVRCTYEDNTCCLVYKPNNENFLLCNAKDFSNYYVSSIPSTDIINVKDQDNLLMPVSLDEGAEDHDNNHDSEHKIPDPAPAHLPDDGDLREHNTAGLTKLTNTTGDITSDSSNHDFNSNDSAFISAINGSCFLTINEKRVIFGLDEIIGGDFMNCSL